MVHLRTRSPLRSTTSGVCDRSRLRVGGGAQSSPSPSATPPRRGGPAVRAVPRRRPPRRRATIITRTGVRSHRHAGTSRPCSRFIASRERRTIPDSGRVDGRVMRMIVWYQRAVEGRPSPCRFTPSCSQYALESLEVHGTRRGLWLALRRLARCRPFGPSGFDPVPEPDVPFRGSDRASRRKRYC